MLVDNVILPVLTGLDMAPLRTTAGDELALLIALDPQVSARTLVHIVAHHEDESVQIWTELAVVNRAARSRMLEHLNRLSAELRWLKFLLVQERVVVVLDVALRESRDPRGLFRGMLIGYLDALQTCWPELAHAAAQRGKRSRLGRELNSLLERRRLTGSDG